MIKKTMMSLLVTTLLSINGFAANAVAHEKSKVDTSIEGIFNALTTSRDLQSTIDTLVAHGADQKSIISIAAAAGISAAKLAEVQVCTNSFTDSAVLSATCLRPSSKQAAFTAGLNNPLSFLPATAAGKK